MNCCGWSDCRRSTRSAIRTSCPADSASAAASPARWPREPSLIIADEAVAALDVSIRAQVVNLLMELQARLGRRVSVHLARHGGGGAGQPSRGGDVSRPDRRDRPAPGGVRRSAASPIRAGCSPRCRSPIRAGAIIRSSWTTARCPARCVGPTIRPSWRRWCGWARTISSRATGSAACTERGGIQVRHTVSRMLLAAALAFGAAGAAHAAKDLVVGVPEQPDRARSGRPQRQPVAVGGAADVRGALHARRTHEAAAAARRELRGERGRQGVHLPSAQGRDVPRRHAVQRGGGEVQLRSRRQSREPSEAAEPVS